MLLTASVRRAITWTTAMQSKFSIVESGVGFVMYDNRRLFRVRQHTIWMNEIADFFLQSKWCSRHIVFFLVYYLFSTRQRVSFSFIHLFRCYATQSKNIQNDILPYARPSLTIFRCAVQFRIHFVLAPNNNRYYCLNSSERSLLRGRRWLIIIFCQGNVLCYRLLDVCRRAHMWFYCCHQQMFFSLHMKYLIRISNGRVTAAQQMQISIYAREEKYSQRLSFW